MRALVTGAGGMLGRSLVAALASEGHEVLGLTHADADVTRPEALGPPMTSFRPEWVFHLAAFTRVDDCESRPEHAHQVNAQGSRNVAEAAAAAGAAVLAISSDYVFPGDASRPYREDDPTGPRSVYGASKLAGEVAVREANARHLVVRTAWLYGHGGTNFIDTILARARRGEALRVVDDQRGSPTATADLAPALIRLASSGRYGTFHCTNAGDGTWHDLATHALARAGITATVARIGSAELGRPAPRPAYSVLSNEAFERATGHRMAPWRDAVDRYLGAGAVSGAAEEGR